MKSKHVGFLLIVVIALGLVALAARLASTELEEPVLSGVSPLNADVIDKVVLHHGNVEVTLVNTDNGWTVGNYPVFQARLEVLWDAAGRFYGADLIASNPENHWLMGVTPESGTLVEFWGDDTLVEKLIVGDKYSLPLGRRQLSAWSSEVRTCYVRRQDSNDVFGIFCFLPDTFAADPEQWNDPVIVEIPPEDIDYLIFKRPKEEFEVRPARGGDWVVVGEDGLEPARSEVIGGIYSLIERLIATGFLSEEEEEIDFSQPDVMLGIVTKPDSDKDSVQLLLLEKDVDNYLIKDASKPYAYIIGSDLVFDLLTSRERFTTEPTD